MSDTNTKVFILPHYNTEDKGDGGVRRVVDALRLYLPSFGVDVVNSIEEADVCNYHGTLYVDTQGKPLVTSCHGLYWREYLWPKWAQDANKRVIDAMVRADEITSPSLWVSKVITRGLLKKPHTIYHGVDADYWDHNLDHYSYVLWNKARVDAVSDPEPALALARLMPHLTFVFTTIGEYDGDLPSNVKVVGVRNYQEMRELVQRAGVYLVTTRETFGIGTLEAMASGVPVVGWNYGGQREIIGNGRTGYLCTSGDYTGLADAVSRAFDERAQLSSNCRDDVRARWQWKDKVAEYAALFRGLRDARREESKLPRATVVITSYNLGSYLDEALNSVAQQTEQNFECIIVDDASTDDTQEIAQRWQEQDSRFKYVRNTSNQGLALSRNKGINVASSKYVLPLDADDALSRDAIARMSLALDEDPGIHIAYGHLSIMDRIERASWPPDQFDWMQQVSHENQLPYSSMARKEALLRVGGYRLRDWRAEDAALWCRMTSHGMYARKVTHTPTLHYRIRSDGKSASESSVFADRDGDWTWFTPWARNTKHTPWAAQGRPLAVKDFWKVPHLEHPTVTVIIPVGDSHVKYLPDALDSLLAQTYADWDVIVVDDTQKQNLKVPAFVKLLQSERGGLGPGVCRNRAVAECNTPYILFLDADDYLTPYALEVLHASLEKTGTAYVYPDGFVEKDGEVTIGLAPDYEHRFWLLEQQLPVTCLMHRQPFLDVQGFDETLQAWEDKDLFIKLAIKGHGGARVNMPLFVYRIQLGERRDAADAKRLTTIFNDRYFSYIEGSSDMCGCTGNTSTMSVAYSHMREGGSEILGGAMEGEEMFMLEFVGKSSGLAPFRGNNGRVYWGGNTPIGRRQEVHADDVEKLLSTQRWRRAPEVVTESFESSDEPFTQDPPQLTKRPRGK